jgi:para-nitrobenzyl esterase
MSGPTLRVVGGLVRGREADGVVEFLGIPYAAAPLGPLRWRPPAPAGPWSGVRDALEPGPLAPQGPPRAGTSLPGEPTLQSEDCLHLNVWTPRLDERRRPVLVWLHGGSFVSGTAGSPLYHGANLARAQDAVVVAVNYRLGALGFLSHPALADRRGPIGNWGLMDQIAALGWVRRHAAAFGGDPENVTLFGESSGAMCVGTLLAMPAARGLFRRVIVQSGPPYTHTAARAAAGAESFARELGLGDVERSRLERVPAADLVGALGAVAQRPAGPGELPQPLLPVVDGTSLPDEPLRAVANGAAPAVPAIVGTNRDEATYFDLSARRTSEMGDEELLRLVSHSAPRVDGRGVVATYRAALAGRGEPSSARDVWTAAASDLVFRWPSLRFAAALGMHGAAVFVYLFTWESPAFGGLLGACHGLDLPFVFGTLRNPAVAAFTGEGPNVDAIAAGIQAAWGAFARGGDPSNDRTGRWAPWEPARRPTMGFGRAIGLLDAPRDEELAVWEAAFPLPTRAAATEPPVETARA